MGLAISCRLERRGAKGQDRRWLRVSTTAEGGGQCPGKCGSTSASSRLQARSKGVGGIRCWAHEGGTGQESVLPGSLDHVQHQAARHESHEGSETDFQTWSLTIHDRLKNGYRPHT